MALLLDWVNLSCASLALELARSVLANATACSLRALLCALTLRAGASINFSCDRLRASSILRSLLPRACSSLSRVNFSPPLTPTSRAAFALVNLASLACKAIFSLRSCISLPFCTRKLSLALPAACLSIIFCCLASSASFREVSVAFTPTSFRPSAVSLKANVTFLPSPTRRDNVPVSFFDLRSIEAAASVTPLISFAIESRSANNLPALRSEFAVVSSIENSLSAITSIRLQRRIDLEDYLE